MSDLSKPPARGPLIPARVLALTLVVFGLLAGVGVSGVVDSDPSPPSTPPAATTPAPVAIPGTSPAKPDANRSSDDEPDGPSVKAHEDAVDERPAGVPFEDVQDGLDQKTADGVTAPVPVGGAQNYSVRSCPVVNQSSRNGQKPLLFVLHYTVSPNRPGWGDVLGICSLFNQRSFAASSTFVADFEGHIARLMSDAAKPWTQGNFNGRSISVEIIATGRETRAQWLASPLIAKGKLSSLMRDTMRRHGLPLRLVNPAGCEVQKAGWTDHNRLECGNAHTDVSPAAGVDAMLPKKGFPLDVVQKQLTAGTTDPKAVAAAKERGKVCNQLRFHRRAASKLPKNSSDRADQIRQVTALKVKAKRIGLDAAKCKP